LGYTNYAHKIKKSHCEEMVTRAPLSGKWAQLPCDTTHKGFIWKRKLNLSSYVVVFRLYNINVGVRMRHTRKSNDLLNTFFFFSKSSIQNLTYTHCLER
uniref:Ovule protein n=1 Tax=Heligmosomoides polygyrus TaxID=6339 RepID=A0A183GHB4_HELPZ